MTVKQSIYTSAYIVPFFRHGNNADMSGSEYCAGIADARHPARCCARTLINGFYAGNFVVRPIILSLPHHCFAHHAALAVVYNISMDKIDIGVKIQPATMQAVNNFCIDAQVDQMRMMPHCRCILKAHLNRCRYVKQYRCRKHTVMDMGK